MSRKKNGSGYLSTFGVIFEIIKKIMDAINDLGGSDNDLHRVLTQSNLAKEIAELIMFGRMKFCEIYKVVVDYGKTYKVVVDYGKSIDEMIKAGNYNSQSYQPFDCYDIHVEGEGQHEVELVLVHANRKINSSEMMEELESLGLMPAKMEHLLAFGATYPEAQKQFKIVALEANWFSIHQDEGNDIYTSYLDSKSGVRTIGYSLGYDFNGGPSWDANCRFLAVCKGKKRKSA